MEGRYIMKSAQYRDQMLEKLDMHLRDDPITEDMTEKEAILLSMLQFIFEINPDAEELSTSALLHLRSIRSWCDKLGKADPRYARDKSEKIQAVLSKWDLIPSEVNQMTAEILQTLQE